ncbi:hypothetical protein [Pigmentiphaga litoralis]|uniref:DUF3887 domain-containing protein n=1 Tax=Pigmentiphaga litoralis TaxID=516702 RepID=A0A7Y9IRY6_9BURK|nr:hypothetical protein [Pigmentiphaga litoralis]NYE24656.1 hypothetical protein [Pigmentiphaga litoralis]NYE81730.1 hypothetical protein [Pigmentiphaga litoralis]
MSPLRGAVSACLLAGACLVSASAFAAQAARSPAAAAPAAGSTSGSSSGSSAASSSTGAPVTITPQLEDRIVMSLLAAIQAKDYQQFVGLGNANFGKLDKAAFDAVSTQLSPRLQAGYTADRLTQYQQQGYEFSLWKISFKDNGDDIIATLNVARDGKVGGFVLR